MEKDSKNGRDASPTSRSVSLENHSVKASENAPHDGTTGLSRTTSEPSYPPTRKVIPILASLMLAQFLLALDRLIIGVAIPQITNEFHSLGDVGWYGSAYLLTSCAFGLFLGRVYTFYNPKLLFVGSLAVFEVGSALCGAAPNSTTLIVGRAIAGLGNAGFFQGAMVTIVHTVPLHKRPQYMGFFGVSMAIASALGPLIGGALTDGPGWRWCFYINLPCGGLAMAFLILFLRIDSEVPERSSTTLREKIDRLDPIGTVFFLPSIICLLLALQWGGSTYDWSNARIIVLLVLGGLLFVAFLIVQKVKGENATVPPRIFFNRSILAGIWFSFFNFAALFTLFYFIPIWFQAVKGVSAVKSGIMNLPLVLGMVVAMILGGVLTRKIGYYTPLMFVGSILAPIGAGLISTFKPATEHPSWIGFQVLFGLGSGVGMMQPSVAAQTVLARKDVPIGASLVMFSQLLGGTIWLSVGNNLLDVHLAKNLAKIPGLDIVSVVKTGATQIRHIVPADKLSEVLVAYNAALRSTFYLAVGLTCVTCLGAAAMPWRSVKQGQQNAQAKADPEKEMVNDT